MAVRTEVLVKVFVKIRIIASTIIFDLIRTSVDEVEVTTKDI